MKNHLLLHNIGHHDFYLLLRIETTEKVVVPMNVHMYSIGKYIYEQLQQHHISFQSDTERKDIVRFSQGISTHKIRDKNVEYKRKRFPLGKEGEIVGVILPILSSVAQSLLDNFPKPEHHFFVQLLTTGEGELTRDRGRSTDYIGQILVIIGGFLFPKITFSHQHDNSTDDFSFEGRPTFFRKKVIPYIHKIRQRIIDHYYEEDKEIWVKNFFVHLSLNTGTTTVFISTLNALQSYNPDFFHVSRSREWPDKKPLEAEYIDQENYQQSPTIKYQDIESNVQQFTIQQMQDWNTYFKKAKPKREHEYDIIKGEKPTFFFRKGKQEVLSVVVVNNTDALSNTERPYLAYRGVNLEVSLPTGSLCAERNAIGTALANNPRLKREHILCIAVLSLGKRGPTLGPCGACREWLTKVSEVNPNFTILTFADEDCTEVYLEAIPID
jgi:cytidine deaminase